MINVVKIKRIAGGLYSSKGSRPITEYVKKNLTMTASSFFQSCKCGNKRYLIDGDIRWSQINEI